jgi:hypothetical protein
MQNKIVINVGTLSSFNNFRYNITSALEQLKNIYISDKKKLDVIWDLRFVESKKMKLNVLTSFLAVARQVRKYLGHAPTTVINWDPYVLQFWRDISFLSVADDNDLFAWQDGMIGGMENYKFNPHNKITYFEDDSEKIFPDIISLENWKGRKRLEIGEKLLNRFEHIINNRSFEERNNLRLRNVLSDTCAELIVNSLLHGKEIAFIGMQRTKAGISICISDGGVGFLTGLNNNQTWAKEIGLKKSSDAILNASLLKLSEYENLDELNHDEIRNSRHIGLLSAINDVLRSGGFVSIHSADAEIRWELPLWNLCLNNFDKDNFRINLQTVENVIGGHPDFPISLEEYYQGYYRIFRTELKGSIVSFEIPNKIHPLRQHDAI